MNTYDYVVIGAGSAGCVVANRLTEDPHVTVLLLEAGGTDQQPAIDDPRAYAQLFNTSVDWAYVTEPEPALNGRSLNWPRGKVLGGTSALNGMIYVRGNRADYDHWRNLGNVNWGYEDVLPYFLKSERNSRGASTWHGADGLLDVTDPPAPHPYSFAFIEAAVELGHPRNLDFNGERQEGAGLWQCTIGKDGKRCSTARAFLHPARARANLHVITGAEATRIVFEGKRAAGVYYVRSGIEAQVFARGEVVLCGGTINSPKLLMLSGIGPAGHLQRLGIPVRVDAPGVGANLQDHPFARVRCWTSGHRPVDVASNLVEAGLFCSSRPGPVAPELYIHFLPVAVVETLNNGKERSAFGIVSAVQRPNSRGELRLRSADPAAAPIIRAGYYSDPADLTLMVEGLKIARGLARTRAFAGIVTEEALPGVAIADDESLEAYVRQTGETIYHPVGTCKMGIDAHAVVDPQLRVRGVEGLRVIDASIMPTITSGNTNAPAIMIGEKGADMIKASASS
ncbi:MAG: GMC family oxidoreductase [Sulfurifustis sp.]